MRITENVTRPDPFTIEFEGKTIPAYPGETVLSAILAADELTIRHDKSKHDRGIYCNMGTCCECIVDVEGHDGSRRRSRACITNAAPGQKIHRIER